MAIQIHPPPQDGPLSASGPNVRLTVHVTNGAYLTAHVKTPSGTSFRLEPEFLSDGQNGLSLSLPPGGVPAGSTLRLVFREFSGQKTVIEYKLQ
jgi:hypothetical protein